ncbi:hypothetical protein SDRG_11281 [Saprolegnia diclina VS20]|uniref:Uncharacterized protein n=1 Tax=Saprolegnia diclina (strain VS20) TaxID=1156394 RepID=T0Q8W9_SAPDV|nr:hypothetical protein SDRG_11281 [Saprolegnia diclina VS20]EQC31096.1 hypothetical protein SDRG_11281 [Saprolegnia diclina VS20]|eukprot:XP_008615535.1 hypothetical protein SDRG_11281 [Saprolegnia diclina VS20]
MMIRPSSREESSSVLVTESLGSDTLGPSSPRRTQSSKLLSRAASRKLPPVVSTPVSAEVAQSWSRSLLSGTAQEAAKAIDELSAAAGNAAAMDTIIGQGGVPALLHHMLRDQALDEASKSLEVLHQFERFAATERSGVPNILGAVGLHVDKSPVVLERKNALRILFAFGYVYNDPSLTSPLVERLLGLLRNLWEPTTSDSIPLTLECLHFLASVPQYRGMLFSHLLSPVSEKRSMSIDAIKVETPKRRGTAIVTEFLTKHPSAIFGSGIEFLKSFMPSVPETVLVRNGVNGLVQLIAKGAEKERASVTALLEELARHDSANDHASHLVCSEIFKAIVGLLSDPNGDDDQKVRAMGVMEKLAKYQKVRRHLHRASVSPELFLVANLASPRPREQAERLLGTLIEAPEFAEFVQASTS